MTLSDATILRVLQEYGFSPDSATREKIDAYISLLLRWNQRVSLTAIRDPEQILRLHFGESIYAVSMGAIGVGRLADVGSGAGFPGIPLSMAISGLRVTLIEPNLKKSVFLAEVKRGLCLDSVEVERVRMQEYQGEPFDFITSRALGQSEDFISFARQNLVPSGSVVLWLGIDDAKRIIEVCHELHWSNPILIPGSERRIILRGRVA
jgi:16S rRNA (guanine527-N7)-methyltransferase